MTNRYPLIVNTTSSQIQELASGDNLDLSGSNISNVGGITVTSTTTAITNGGTNGVGNIGTSGTYFNTVFAKATSAQYADVAENYSADTTYLPGTVLSIGGSAEVTVSLVDNDPLVVGVVSTQPAYLMNSTLDTDYPVAVALTGRVPCLVQGPINRGDMLVSAGNGSARAEKNPAMGTVIGKALESIEGNGTIEVVVGRL
jgi:hypothetical protein